MKTAAWLFTWHFQVTLIDGKIVNLLDSSCISIYDLQEILSQHNITVSDSTLYRMKSERCYAVKPFLPEDSREWGKHSKQKIGSFDKVAEWHIYIRRSVKKFCYLGENQTKRYNPARHE